MWKRWSSLFSSSSSSIFLFLRLKPQTSPPPCPSSAASARWRGRSAVSVSLRSREERMDLRRHWRWITITMRTTRNSREWVGIGARAGRWRNLEGGCREEECSGWFWETLGRRSMFMQRGSRSFSMFLIFPWGVLFVRSSILGLLSTSRFLFFFLISMCKVSLEVDI